MLAHRERSGGSHHGLGNGGCCKTGEPAGILIDATGRNGQHVGRPKWDRPGFDMRLKDGGPAPPLAGEMLSEAPPPPFAGEMPL
jgi:hypothetical protein